MSEETLQPFDVSGDNFGLLDYVEGRMECERHKLMGQPLDKGEMLSLVICPWFLFDRRSSFKWKHGNTVDIHTSCEANYALSRSQRNGDYSKWKFLDLCLYDAISVLSEFESFEFPLYCGVANVSMTDKRIDKGYFSSYVSTSFDREVAESFCRQQATGLMFEFRDHMSSLSHPWLTCDAREK